MLVSGPSWCEKFPTSVMISDLTPAFRDKVSAFHQALRDAGAKITVSATYRPPQRAYLMHWCLLVAGYKDKSGEFHQVNPEDVPPYTGVDIDWTHAGDDAAAISAGDAMAKTYCIKYPASLTSRHIERRAIDMNILALGLSVKVGATPVTGLPGKGEVVHIADAEVLNKVGASYGVIKLVSDPPHWSDDGH